MTRREEKREIRSGTAFFTALRGGFGDSFGGEGARGSFLTGSAIDIGVDSRRLQGRDSSSSLVTLASPYSSSSSSGADDVPERDSSESRLGGGKSTIGSVLWRRGLSRGCLNEPFAKHE